jgi:hypothetical protein
LGAYTVRVSNQAGSTESAPVTLSPNSAPVILGQPQSTNVLAGLRFALSVYAPGAAPLSWQWFKNGVPISGATSATLDVDAAQLADSGTYTVEIANAFGTTRSAPCTVNVLFPVHFITQPQPANILEGGSLSLSVQAGGSGPISYQWLKNGIGIAGATNATLNIPNAGISDSGTYSVSISNPVGFLLSDSVQVSVQPGNSEQGAGRLIIGGTPFEGFQVSALGVPGQTYDVQVSSNIGGPWVTLQTVTVDSSGRFAITPPPLSINRTWFVRTVRH